MRKNRTIGFLMLFGKTWQLLRDRRVPKKTKLIPIIAIIYILSPIDIIPDFLVGPGLLDDVGILLLSMYAFFSLIPKDVLIKYNRSNYNERINSNDESKKSEKIIS